MLATLRRYGRNAQWRLRRGAEAAGFAGMGTAAAFQANRDRRAGMRKLGSVHLKSRLRRPKKSIRSSAVRGKDSYSKKRVNNKKRKRSGTSRSNKKFAQKVRAVLSKNTPSAKLRKIGFGEIEVNECISGTYGSKALFNTYRKGGYTVPYLADDQQLIFYNGKKLGDAAGVCFNGKSLTNDWRTETGNFPKDTSVHFQYASMNLSLKNLTSVSYDIIVHEYTAKDNNFAHPITEWKQRIAITPGSTPTVTNIDTFRARCEIGLKLSDYGPLQHWSLKSKKYEKVMPGGIIKYFTSRKDFKFDTKYADTSTSYWAYPKGCVVIIYEFVPRMMCNFTGTEFFAMAGSVTENTGIGFCLQVEEIYKMDQPGDTTDANEGDKLFIYTDLDTRGATITGRFQCEEHNPNVTTITAANT